jgi:hypothetical protein
MLAVPHGQLAFSGNVLDRDDSNLTLRTVHHHFEPAIWDARVINKSEQTSVPSRVNDHSLFFHIHLRKLEAVPVAPHGRCKRAATTQQPTVLTNTSLWRQWHGRCQSDPSTSANELQARELFPTIAAMFARSTVAVITIDTPSGVIAQATKARALAYTTSAVARLILKCDSLRVQATA